MCGLATYFNRIRSYDIISISVIRRNENRRQYEMSSSYSGEEEEEEIPSTKSLLLNGQHSHSNHTTSSAAAAASATDNNNHHHLTISYPVMMSSSVTPDLLLNAVSASHRQRDSEEEEVGGVYHELEDEDEEDDYAEIPANDVISDDVITHHPSTAAATGENVNMTREDIYYVALCVTHLFHDRISHNYDALIMLKPRKQTLKAASLQVFPQRWNCILMHDAKQYMNR